MNIAQKKVNTGNFIIYFGLFLALLAVNGLLNFISAKFDPQVFLDAGYWLKTITGSASGLSAFVIFAFLRRDTLLVHDLDFNTDLKELNSIVRSEIGPNFSKFIAKKNLNSKKERWRQINNEKMVKWHAKIPAKVLTALSFPLNEKGRRKCSRTLNRKANKWQRKKDKIQNYLNEEWIDKNIYYRKLKYPETTTGEILSGQRSNKNNKVIDNNAIGKILTERLPVIMITVLLQAFYNAMMIEQAAGLAEIWLGVLFQMITIFTNVAIGLNYGSTLFAKLDKANLTTRREYLIEYLQVKENYE